MELHFLEKISIILLLAFYAIVPFFFIRYKNKQEVYKDNRNRILILIIGAIIPSIYLFIRAFGWSSLVSTNMQDWGAYATCLATITSFVSVVLIYLTYKAQSEMYKEQSRISYLSKFNEIFTDMLQVQRELYNKTNPNIFYELHGHVILLLKGVYKKLDPNNGTMEINDSFLRFFVKKAYGTFFDKKSKRYSNPLLVLDKKINRKFTPREFDNLRNYFKYLYHLVIYVALNKDLTVYDKSIYMNMIQAQMSTDELFCYMINVMDYYYRVDGRISNSVPDGIYSGVDNDQENKAYINILFQYDFFEDLFRKPNDVETNEQLDKLFYKEFDFNFETHQRNKEPRKNFKLFPLDPC